MVASTKKGQRGISRLFLSACFVILAALLTACGQAANTDFSLPLPQGIDSNPVASCTNTDPGNDAFCKTLMQPARQDLAYQSVQIYNAAGKERVDLGDFYRKEMVNRQWSNVSPNILKNDELGTSASVLAFEKYTDGDINKKHVVGVIILSPEVKNDALNSFRDSKNLKGNILITIEGGNVPIPSPSPAK